jgi:hypothetical protein
VEGSSRELIYYPSIFLDGMRKTTKNKKKGILYAGRDSNKGFTASRPGPKIFGISYSIMSFTFFYHNPKRKKKTIILKVSNIYSFKEWNFFKLNYLHQESVVVIAMGQPRDRGSILDRCKWVLSPPKRLVRLWVTSTLSPVQSGRWSLTPPVQRLRMPAHLHVPF